MQPGADLVAREALGFAEQQTRAVPGRQPAQGGADELRAFAAQGFALGVVGVAAQECGGRDGGFAVVADCTAAAFQGFPAHQLAAAQLGDAGVSCEAEEPGLDFEGDRRAAVPGAVRTTLCRARQRLKLEYVALGGEPAAA
jgi:hypothetical protein